MSIINDALKKVQEGLAHKTGETPATPEAPKPFAYSSLKEPSAQNNELPVVQASPSKNKAVSVLAMICAILITIGAFVFFFRQLNSHFPQFKRSVKSSFYKLMNKKEIPEFKTKAPADLKPLAQITITPAASSPTIKGPAPITLNIHGIMSNGSGNLVLINDSVYQEGDDVDGAKIVKINLDSITVNNNGVEQTIFVKN